ncbi:putative flavoprotein involved in K+ transport [Saccharopolyspora antimicrobica]|uniref:Flavoprotein involved in K+ transport n=1 Tax=Saccharopolyspora antimicrobica TaxID=455193 RepID=A0A1I4TSZ6_9PSEU|nr:NAD(P)/FAD-dependent oxidoreductase [Saccharopolyspora antimicrobica]RKT88536.1 putative flavoprotein involved in K+ transport [Saccharopolyspora antimicrobica]SFM79705.1 putative flavoprotein involved in K+ transport [Saccharopolyspora antimicrobica]
MSRVIVIGGGQSGIAAAQALLERGARPLVLESGPKATGSWPHYYDSLTLFTPAWFNALPGAPLPGDPNRYPTGAEVADYLRSRAESLDCEIRTGHRVTSVTSDPAGFLVRTEHGAELTGTAVVAATGIFGNPHRPELPALDGYTGVVRHSADYRSPEPFAGQRVVVVGAGNSAVQIAVELAEHAEVTLATRKPIQYATNQPIPGDSRFWSVLSAAARLPLGPLLGHGTIPVVDIAGYKAAIDAGKPDRREMFVAAEGTSLRWPDGTAEHVDAVILATGYRPALDYLRPLGVLDEAGRPRQRHGISHTHPGLTFVGLEHQRSILSGTMHGCGRDARHVARRLTPSRS